MADAKPEPSFEERVAAAERAVRIECMPREHLQAELHKALGRIAELEAKRAHATTSPTPAAKTELTADNLAFLRRAVSSITWLRYDAIRLLDEHAAMRKELERLRNLEQLGQSAGDMTPDELRWILAHWGCPEVRRLLDEHANRAKVIALQAENISGYCARIAELETALAIATEAVAAEARAKVEGLTCTREERACLDRIAAGTGHGEVWKAYDRVPPSTAELFNAVELQHAEFPDVTREQIAMARREAAKAKGDGNG